MIVIEPRIHNNICITAHRKDARPKFEPKSISNAN